MGWGCYKHEWDAASRAWEKFEHDLCMRKLEDRPKTFGRDGRVCPRCYVELESDYAALEAENARLLAALVEVLNIVREFGESAGVPKATLDNLMDVIAAAQEPRDARTPAQSDVGAT